MRNDSLGVVIMVVRRSGARIILLAGIAHAGSAASAASTLFRIDEMALRDPHVFVQFGNCIDITDSPLLGFSINGSLQSHIQGDADPADGFLDLSYVAEFQPLDQAAATNALSFGKAECTAPRATSTCAPFTSAIDTTATLSAAGTCLAPLDNTTKGYTPAVASPPAPCFSSAPATFQFVLAGLPITLHDMQAAATFDGVPATALNTGLIRGFLSQADADATIIPASIPLIGGKPLSSLLPGGTGACPAYSDKDLDGATAGWWFYLNFAANPVTADRIFADTFE